ncbi:leucine--tRNA ligase [Candidatus Woesearchaeota archaeon]|nr:leucine--tRNA ligase [Candidatus Woesearchaeota archaeon]
MVDFSKIEKKWQKRWEEKKVFQVKDNPKKKKFYVLEMFPYPSGSGLHMGHAFNYTIGDIYARFKRMMGFNVLYPVGYDSFGLPAENAAILAKEHPKKFTENSIKNFIRQQKEIGLSYDWNRLLMTHTPEYYKWNQYFFLKFFENGLVYKDKASVNWCPKCDTVLANEQVHNGKCWRHKDTDVETKQLEQWFIKTTKYAEELLNDIEKLQWPERIKIMQENWIGKSHGTEIDFEINTNSNFVLLHGFTGSPDANFFPWLKKELENKGCKVSVPRLPNSNNPDIIEQVNYVINNYSFNENTVLLGHSLGSVVALKVLEKLNKPIKKLVLAAGFCEPKFKDKKRPFEERFNWKFDFEKIKNNIQSVIILRARNDSAVPAERSDKIKEKIGGIIIDFEAEDDHICGNKEPEVLKNCLNLFPIFTTRPDTLFGVTFMVISAQHPRLYEIVTKEQKKEVDNFLKKIKSTKEEDIAQLEKDGVFTGSYAIHPLTNQKIPVYAGNFVIAEYGSGMVMAVPAHDQRDFEFARKYKLPIKLVIQSKDKKIGEKNLKEAFVDNGILVNSEKFNGLNSEEAKIRITKELENKKLGKPTVNYKLRDWLISRQRYWGTPIPIIYCDDCGIVSVPEKDLPVKLPDKVEFGKGNPLTTNKGFVNVKCPKCKKNAKRETDTMDTFFDSSWYFLRYCDNKNSKNPFDIKKIDYWMPVNQYIGGAEHACMHLIYARFFTKALRDLSYVKIDEPFIKLFNQGMLHGEDGFVMSKSRGNVVLPETVSREYGMDTARLFLISGAAPDKDMEWSSKGVEGSLRFVKRLIEYTPNVKLGKTVKKVESKLNKTIKEVTKDIEDFRYNFAVIKIRDLFDSLGEEINKKDLEKFLKLVHPFCPHITEELWEQIGNKSFLSLEKWPEYDESKIDVKYEQAEKAFTNLISDITNVINVMKEKQGKEFNKVYVYSLPNEMEYYDSKDLSNRVNKEVIVYSVSDKNKHDPENKSKRAKPGKPAIFLE